MPANTVQTLTDLNDLPCRLKVSMPKESENIENPNVEKKVEIVLLL